MRVGYKAIRERLVSRVTLDRAEAENPRRICRGAVQPSRKRLDLRARRRRARACKVEFFIDYAFSSRMLAALMGAMFDAAFRKFSDAFVARADVSLTARGGRRSQDPLRPGKPEQQPATSQQAATASEPVTHKLSASAGAATARQTSATPTRRADGSYRSCKPAARARGRRGRVARTAGENMQQRKDDAPGQERLPERIDQCRHVPAAGENAALRR